VVVPYSAEISRANPTCFLFLIDRSGSMLDVLDPQDVRPLNPPQVVDGRTYTQTAAGRTKAQGVADALNRLLQTLVIRCTKQEGIRDYFHVGVIGYGRTTGPALSGSLSGRDLVPISEIGQSPARVDERVRKEDDGAGGLMERKIRMPIWFDPVGDGGTPMCEAIARAHGIVSGFLGQYPNCFPPVVIHITDGESTDGDPSGAMAALTTLASSDGNVLLFNVHLSSNPNARPITFPDNGAGLPDEYAQMLFNAASSLTPTMRRAAEAEHGLRLADGARGFVLNADMTLVIQALDIGTRPANLAER
jgi:hypothetical protein